MEEQWREVDEKEFHQLLIFLDLKPIGGYCTSFGSATRYGREDLPLVAQIDRRGESIIYKIRQN